MNIIDGRQRKKWKAVELVITTFGWVFVIGLTLQIILSIILWIFNLTFIYSQFILLGELEDSIFIFLITLIISVVSFLIIYLWGSYNYKRYGHLKRRTLPEDVTKEEIAEFFSIPRSQVEEYCTDKYIVLEKNII